MLADVYSKKEKNSNLSVYISFNHYAKLRNAKFLTGPILGRLISRGNFLEKH